MYLRSLDDNSGLITTMGLNNPESNVFNKSFDMEEWDDWMQWEGGVIDFETPTVDRKESRSSSISLPEFWPADIESAGKDAASASLFPGNEFRFGNVPFELDGTSQSYRGLPLGATTVFSTKMQIPQEVRRFFRGFSSLTQAEEQSLQNIAMPCSQLAQVKITSEQSSSTAVKSCPSPYLTPEPQTRTRTNKKRKSIIDDEVPSALCQSKKRGHNAIEKRYRTNLNEKINCLRLGVPSLCKTSSKESKSGDKEEESDGEGGDSRTEQQKFGKAAILARALEYIKHLENTTHRLGGEVGALKTRVAAFEKLAMSGRFLNGNRDLAPIGDSSTKIETLESIQTGKSFFRDYQKSNINRMPVDFQQINRNPRPRRQVQAEEEAQSGFLRQAGVGCVAAV
jgi:hypothetical protein